MPTVDENCSVRFILYMCMKIFTVYTLVIVYAIPSLNKDVIIIIYYNTTIKCEG